MHSVSCAPCPFRAAFGISRPAGAPPGASRWAAAVDLGALGRAAAARRLLAEVETAAPAAMRSLARSTRASLTRQAGRHDIARGDDGAACAIVAPLLVGSDVAPGNTAGGDAAAQDAADDWVRAAWVDGLIGLAADGLGIGAFAASASLLSRAARVLDAAVPAGIGDDAAWVTGDRLRLRLGWVRVEHGLYSGDLAAAARFIGPARDLAAAGPSPRHRIKTDLIAAAVMAAHGRTDEAIAQARTVHDETAAAGLAPLQWAAATMLSGLVRPGDGYARTAADLRGRLAVAGMAFPGGD